MQRAKIVRCQWGVQCPFLVYAFDVKTEFKQTWMMIFTKFERTCSEEEETQYNKKVNEHADGRRTNSAPEGELKRM